MQPPAGGPSARPGAAGTPPPAHPVTITVDTAHPGPAVPGDFAGLSFERGALTPGNAGVTGYLFSPENTSLITVFRNLGVRHLRVGAGTVDLLPPAGTGRDGFAGRERQGEPIPALRRANCPGADSDRDALALQDGRDRLPCFGFLERKQPVQRFHDGDRNSEPCKDLAQLQTNRAPAEHDQ